jgi:hypothetical protein
MSAYERAEKALISTNSSEKIVEADLPEKADQDKRKQEEDSVKAWKTYNLLYTLAAIIFLIVSLLIALS